MVMEPLPDVVVRTGRATRPGMVIGAVIVAGCETTRVRVAAVGVIVPTLAFRGFAAPVGVGVLADDMVGVSEPVFWVVAVDVLLMVGPAAKRPALVESAVLVGVVVEPEFTKTGAVTELGAVADAVTELVVAAELTPPMTTAPPTSPVTPLVMTGVGAELIDEFTVDSGLAYMAGGTNWPVGTSRP